MLVTVEKKYINSVDDLKNLCIDNKNDLKFDFNHDTYSNKICWICDNNYNFFVDGVGNKSVKLNNHFFRYEYLFKCLNNENKYKNPILINNFLSLIIDDF